MEKGCFCRQNILFLELITDKVIDVDVHVKKNPSFLKMRRSICHEFNFPTVQFIFSFMDRDIPALGKMENEDRIYQKQIPQTIASGSEKFQSSIYQLRRPLHRNNFTVS
jgi:hypothetical protein